MQMVARDLCRPGSTDRAPISVVACLPGLNTSTARTFRASSGHAPVRRMNMKTIFYLLKQALGGQNQFASGGLLLMIIGAVGVYLRSLPVRLWTWLTYQTTMMLTVTDDDTAFEWIKEWFLEQKFLKRVRWLDLDTSLRGDEAALIPAPGQHRFWYGGRPFWVWFSRKDDTQGWTPRRMESLTFRTIGRDPEFLKRFVRDV